MVLSKIREGQDLTAQLDLAVVVVVVDLVALVQNLER